MNDIDRNVETVLRGLRDAQPDASLEQRIAQALQAEPPAPATASWLRDWGFAWCLAGAAVAGVVLVVVLLHLRPAPHSREATQLATRTAPAPAAAPRSGHNEPEDAQPHRASVASHTAIRRTARVHGQVVRSSEPESFPAPELPLTEQERLLLRLMHRDDPVQLARLAPGPRAARYQAEKDAVSEFFKPPEQQPEPTVVEPGGGTQ